MINIPLPVASPPLPYWDLVASLDGVKYTLRFYWDARALDSETGAATGAWYLLILDEPGRTVIAGAVRIVANWPLWRGITGRQPPGSLIFANVSGTGDPRLNDLGTRTLLYYATAAEVAAGKLA